MQNYKKILENYHFWGKNKYLCTQIIGLLNNYNIIIGEFENEKDEFNCSSALYAAHSW